MGAALGATAISNSMFCQIAAYGCAAENWVEARLDIVSLTISRKVERSGGT
jgi:hypothetical protein